MFDPEYGAGQVGETAGGEAIPDHLGGEVLDHLVAPVLGEFAAQDHGSITGSLARVDPDATPPYSVAVACALVDVIVQGLHGAQSLLYPLSGATPSPGRLTTRSITPYSTASWEPSM